MRAGRTTNIASVIKMLGAFVATAMVIGLLVAGVAMPAVGAIGSITRSGIDVFDSLPTSFSAAPLSQQSRLTDVTGAPLTTLYDENRVIVPLTSVAPIMQQAQVAIEDSRFYEHGGLDVRGVVRAVVSNAQGDVVQGGSTLTQQYVKLLLQETAIKNGDPAAASAATTRTGLAGLTRKLQELKYSIQLEKTQTKAQILQGYLNITYYGDRAYGVEAASQHYFSHSAKTLSVVESALLAGLVQNPSSTDPINNPTKALARRNVVLDRMLELKVITKKQHDAARVVTIAQMLHVSQPQNSCAGAGDNAYFCEYALQYVLLDPSFNAMLGKTVEERKAKIYRGGVTIKTSIEPGFSAMMRNEIVQRVPQGYTERNIKIGSAAVSIDPNTGQVRGMAQNTQYSATSTAWDHTSVNWAVDQKYGGSGGFQFGSTAKAFALVTALENNLPINTRVQAREASAASPTTFTAKDFPGGADQCGLQGTSWTVKNEAAGEGGPRTLSEATARSINTAFVALTQQLGACKVRDTEIRLGMHLANGQPVLHGPAAIVLGAQEISPMTVANAYGVMAAGGKLCTADPIVAITDSTGKALPIPAPGTSNCTQVVAPDVAAGVARIMKATLDPAQLGTAAASALAAGRIAAGKTGTSDKNNETWFVGYTPTLVTAVWTGTPLENHSALDNIHLPGGPFPVVYGASVSAPIWKGIMDNALSGSPNADFPAPSQTIIGGNIQPVPYVAGHTVADATTILAAQGFGATVGRTTYSNYRAGLVIGTDPQGQVPVGTTVSLIISAGPGGYQTPIRPQGQPATTPTTPATAPSQTKGP
ncbi:transglycosylase domain-containing protein [Lapillicoccus sp.]|uniref:transglycosylase domain-containing protein n=1 Tax=Lapillicoccus sp. TaxID=1909287 RepID=UPI0025D07D75|nr:transglycosylase domain-containing protein [Lapillicoccus sp.]